MGKKRVLQILVPCIILAAIVGLYLIKNPPVSEPENRNTEEAATLEGGADFSLAVTEAVDFEEMSSYGLPMIIDYGSDSCIPCKQMAPVLETMNKEMENKAFIKFVDVWKYTEAANNVPVQVIPTQVLVNADGTPFVPSDELAGQIEFIQYTSRDTGEHVFTVHQGGMTEEQMRLILAEMVVGD